MNDATEWTCLACGGPVVPMGTLGQLEHGRCRNCGITQSHAHGAGYANEPEEDCADCGCSLHDEFNRDGYSHMGESPRCKSCFDAHCFGQLPEDT